MIYSWGIIGHDRQLKQLEKELLEDKLVHAYLFTGPADTGKFTVAEQFAAILLCPNKLCGQCQSCKLMRTGAHPDLIVMRDEGGAVGIDDVRALIQKTNLTSQGRLRVVLIENLERMPVEAQNSFLKTLEEPPGRTVFLLTSTQTKKIVPTILSRVRQERFMLVSDGVMRAALIERFQDHADLDDVMELAQGRPGLAFSLLKDPSLLAKHRSIFNQIDQFLKYNDLPAKFTFAEEIEGDSEKLELFLNSFCLVLRRYAYDFVKGKSITFSDRFNLKELVDLFENLMKTRYLIERNANKKLSLENFLLKTETL